jgi:hypothetical protein
MNLLNAASAMEHLMTLPVEDWSEWLARHGFDEVQQQEIMDALLEAVDLEETESAHAHSPSLKHQTAIEYFEPA